MNLFGMLSFVELWVILKDTEQIINNMMHVPFLYVLEEILVIYLQRGQKKKYLFILFYMFDRPQNGNNHFSLNLGDIFCASFIIKLGAI